MGALTSVREGLVRPAPGLRGPYVYTYPRPARVNGLAVCEPRSAYGPDAGGGVSEAILQAAWRRAGDHRLTLQARDGRTYKVLYPGRPGAGRGPDFLDAIVERDDGARLYGDIELHVRPGDWRAHGHGLDRRYNGVMFHVSLTDGPDDTDLASGRRVPLLVLGAGLGRLAPPTHAESKPDASHGAGPDSATGDGPGRVILAAPPVAAPAGSAQPEHQGHPGGGRHGPPPGIPAAGPAHVAPAPRLSPAPFPFMDLGAAGDQRFLSKSSGYEIEISRVGADQAFYAGVLECLGYPRNRRPFTELAQRAPWTLLKGVLATSPAQPGAAGLVLLWAAGLGARPELSGLPALTGRKPDFDLPGGRPDNHPARRIRGAAALVERWARAGGPAAYFADLVSGGNGAGGLTDALAVLGPAPGRSLIGPGRAGETAVNAVLPSLHAWARLRGDGALAALALETYRRFPPLPGNAITKEALALLAGQGLRPHVRGAREQQGLQFLYRAMTSPLVRPQQLPLL